MDVLAGIELAPVLCRLLLAWESGILGSPPTRLESCPPSRGNPGFSSPPTRLESCPPSRGNPGFSSPPHALGELPALTWIAAAARHLFRVVL